MSNGTPLTFAEEQKLASTKELLERAPAPVRDKLLKITQFEQNTRQKPFLAPKSRFLNVVHSITPSGNQSVWKVACINEPENLLPTSRDTSHNPKEIEVLRSIWICWFHLLEWVGFHKQTLSLISNPFCVPSKNNTFGFYEKKVV